MQTPGLSLRVQFYRKQKLSVCEMKQPLGTTREEGEGKKKT